MTGYISPSAKERIDDSVMQAGNPQPQLSPNLIKGMAYLNDLVQNNLMQQEQQQQQAEPAPQVEQPALAYTQGLMPALAEGTATYQARPMPGEEVQPRQNMPLNQMAKVLADQVVQAKGIYDQAAQVGNEEAMMQAHSAAEQARTGLNQLGVDPGAYGLNGTYQEAQQAMASNNLQAMQNILEGDMSKSSMGHYDDTYNYLINQGYSRAVASEVAGQKAKSYAIQRTRELENAFNMYGHDGRVINPMGVQILQKLAEEEPDMANYYVSRYAGPLQEYAKANQRENAAIQHQYGKEDMALKHSYDLDNAQVAQQYRLQLADYNAQIAEAHANNDAIRKVQTAAAMYEMQSKYGVGKGAGKVNGYSEKQAKQAAEMIKQIDTKLANGLDLSDDEKKKLNEDRARYQVIVDSYCGMGQTEVAGGKDYNFNDYNDAMAFAKEKMQENADKGYPYGKAELRNMLRAYIGDWADDVEFGGDNEQMEAQVSEPTSEPQRVVPVSSTPTINNYGYTGGAYEQANSYSNRPKGGFNLGLDLSSILESMRNNPVQTEAGNMAMRRYGR